MRDKIIAIVLGISTSLSVLAQESGSKMEFSLQGAIDYAMEHNKNLKNARQELIKSDKSIWEAISQGLPQADAMLDYMTYFNYELAFSFGGDENFEFTQAQIEDATNQTLSNFPGIPAAGISGITRQDIYNYSAGQFYSNTLQGMMPPSTILMSDQMTAKLQVSQLIFSGQYIVGIQTAKLGKKISSEALDNSEIDTKESVINAYYLVLISEASLKTVEDNLKNLEKILKQTQKMYETGMAESIDVDQFQVTVNQLENTTRSMSRNLEMTYNMLRLTLGLPAGTEIILTEDIHDLFHEMEVAEVLNLQFNKEDNISYQILNSQANINEKLWDIEKWNYGPTLSAYYNYNFKLKTTGFDMTPNNLAGFSFNLPIFSSGMREAKTAQARIDYEIAERNAEILGDQLELQNNQLKYNLKNSLDNYYTQQENVKVASRVLKNYQRKYEQGMASSLDVTQSNTNYLEAEGNYLNAMFEVMNAQIQLEKLINNLSSL